MKKKLLLSLILVISLVMSGTVMAYANTDGNNQIIVAETDDGNTTEEGVETPPPEEEPDPPSLIIQNVPATMEVGETASLSYSLKNSEEEVTWHSENSDIVSVDAEGKITANSPGSAKITAKAGSAKDSTTITVKAIQPESIKIVSDNFNITNTVTGYEIKKGETIKLEVEVKPKEATVSGITWEVSDEKIAEIDSDGNLTGLEKGEITVTANTDDGLTTDIDAKVGTDIAWGLIAAIALIAIIIIVLVVLVIRKKMRDRRSGGGRQSKYYDDDDDDEDEDNESGDDNDYDKSKKEREAEQLERLRQEAYRQGYQDREKEMTRVFNPKDFDVKDDDIE